jgi:hypothetical protein
MPKSLLFILILFALGCSEKERTIATAKKLEESELSTPSEIPAKPAPKESSAAAKALVLECLNAHTGNKPDAVKALKSHEYVRKGFILSQTQEQMFQTWTVKATWPYQYRVTADIAGYPSVVLAWSGNAGYRQLPGPPTGPAMELPPAEVRDYQLDVTGEWLLLLFPFLEAETVVDMEPAKKARGKMLPTVRIWHPALSEATVSFDPNTKRLAQITFNGRESGRLVVKEFLPLEFTDFAGVQLPKKLAQNANGKQLADWTYSTLEAKTHEAKVFVKP